MEKIITEKKTTELTIPKQLNGLLENVSKVAMAQKPTELEEPLEFLVLSKDKLEDIKDDFKAKIAEYKASLEQVEDALEELERDIKSKALELLEFKEEFKTDKNGNVKANALGEIELTREHNLPTKLFSYTPQTTNWVVNEEELLANPEKYKEFVKLVPTIDKKALKTSPNLFDLPRVQKTKEQSISIQGKLIIEKIKIKELGNE